MSDTDRIVLDDGDVPNLDDKADAIRAGIAKDVFRSGDHLVEVSIIDGSAREAFLGPERLGYIASRNIMFTHTKIGKDGTPIRLIRHPWRDAINILAAPGMHPGVRPLDGIVSHPIVGPDGQIITEPGYSTAARLFVHLPDDLRGIEIPSQPSAEDISEAVSLFREWLVDFPFEQAADFAAAVGAFLTLLVRPLINGPVALWLVSAPAPGTGKTLLVAVIGDGAGISMQVLTDTKDPVEMKKAVEASLMVAPELILLDNLNGRIDFGFLAGILTAGVYHARRLGFSEHVQIVVKAMFCLTANNPSMSDEFGRRVVLTRLVPDQERPWQREGFRHPDIRGWTAEHRRELIAAGLTLARAWIAAGRPAPSGKPLGSFEAWSHVVGGILENAGIPGFLGNIDDLIENADTVTASWISFVESWHRTHGEQLVRVADLVELALGSEVIEEGRTGRGTQSSLGKALARMTDRIFGGKQIHRGPKVAGLQFWKVVSVGHDGPGGLSSTLTREKNENDILICNSSKQVPQVPKSTCSSCAHVSACSFPHEDGTVCLDFQAAQV